MRFEGLIDRLQKCSGFLGTGAADHTISFANANSNNMHKREKAGQWTR